MHRTARSNWHLPEWAQRWLEHDAEHKQARSISFNQEAAHVRLLLSALQRAFNSVIGSPPQSSKSTAVCGYLVKSHGLIVCKAHT